MAEKMSPLRGSRQLHNVKLGNWILLTKNKCYSECSRIDTCRYSIDCNIIDVLKHVNVSLQYVEAVEKYRDVLRSVDSHRENVRTDDLQQLHTLHNLQETLALAARQASLTPTIRDSQLVQQARY